MIPLKSEAEIEAIRQSCVRVVKVVGQIRNYIKPSITTQEINQLAEQLIRNEDAISAFKGYKGYPASICTSVNEEVVHAIPGTRILKEGDIISLDLGLDYKGYFSDIAITLAVGKISARTQRLIDETKRSLELGIKQAVEGNHLSDISHAIQRHVEASGFSVVREFVGHGIGSRMHEEPEIPNFGSPHKGPVLKAGMVLAIEPMVNMGSWEVEVLSDGWTAVTKDRLPSAHFEHTVAITKTGAQVLTN